MIDPIVVTVGKEVPDFEMEVYNPEHREFGKISLKGLKEQKKWTVLVFYPADFTFVCPTELADLAAQHEKLRAMEAEVISVSTDTKYAHMAWRDTEKLLKDVKYLMGVALRAEAENGQRFAFKHAQVSVFVRIYFCGHGLYFC